MKLSNKEIIKALLAHKETLPSFEDWDGETKTSISLRSFKLTFKANKAACEAVIVKYEKNRQTPNFQGSLLWAWRNTRNFNQKKLSDSDLIGLGFSCE